MVYLQINMGKYKVDLEIMINYDLSFSPFCEYLFIFSQIQNYSYSTCSINDKWVSGPCQIFGKFQLTFEIQIRR
jgi:hypothetical protein